MEHVTTVLIADSADDFCTALTAALQHADGFQVVGTANAGNRPFAWWRSGSPTFWCWI